MSKPNVLRIKSVLSTDTSNSLERVWVRTHLWSRVGRRENITHKVRQLREKIVTFPAMSGSHVNYNLKGVFITGIKSEQY